MPLTTGILLGFAAGLAPGPLLALTISQSLTYGVIEGIKVALAPLLTDIPIILTALWLLLCFQSVDVVLGGVSLLGGLYVFYLAVENFRAKPMSGAVIQTAPRSLMKAVIVNALNPHPYLFWMTVGGPMMLRHGRQSLTPAAIFLLSFYLCLVGSKVLLSVITGRFREFISSRHYLHLVKLLGVALCIFAARLMKDALVFLNLLSP